MQIQSISRVSGGKCVCFQCPGLRKPLWCRHSPLIQGKYRRRCLHARALQDPSQRRQGSPVLEPCRERPWASGPVIQRQVLHLGEIGDNERTAWRRSIKVLEGKTGTRRLTLFPEDRAVSESEGDVVPVKVRDLELHDRRQWGSDVRMESGFCQVQMKIRYQCAINDIGVKDGGKASARYVEASPSRRPTLPFRKAQLRDCRLSCPCSRSHATHGMARECRSRRQRRLLPRVASATCNESRGHQFPKMTERCRLARPVTVLGKRVSVVPRGSGLKAMTVRFHIFLSG